jgi:hypothetical protein
METLFYVLPFVLFLGIAAQGVAYYLICFLIPFGFYLFHRRKIPSYFNTIGLIFIALHIIFPIVNLMVFFFPNDEFLRFYRSPFEHWPGAFQSCFPSSLFFGGLLFCLLPYLSGFFSKPKKKRSNFDHFQPIRPFLTGLLPASLIFTAILYYSHHTGLDLRSLFRKRLEFMGPNDAFSTGGYRVNGFYGHPLTVAGACLAYCLFCWSLFWSYLSTKSRDMDKWSFLPFFRSPLLALGLLGSISVLNFLSIVMSGGRLALLVAVLMIVGIPCAMQLKKHFFSTLIVCMALLVGMFFVAKQVGILSRLEATKVALLSKHQFDDGNNRIYFWKTYEKMFLDSPIIGQGNYWIKHGVRDEYYKIMGYEKLEEKFGAHNLYLEILGSAGLLGLIWVFSGFILLFREIKNRFYEKGSPLRPYCFALMIAFVGNLIHCLTQNVFFDSSVVYIYLGLFMILVWQGAKNWIEE